MTEGRNDRQTECRLTAEWTLDKSDEPKLDKLIAYARRLGLGDPFRDSYDPDEERRS